MADAAGNRYGPYDIEVPDSEAEALTEEAWFDLFGDISGVKSGGALSFAGLTATLAAIDARVHGSYLIRTDPWSDASPATASGGSPRRDMLVARRQRTSGEGVGAVAGKTFLTVLRGAPAAAPAEPTTYDPVNDEPLWSWQVPGNAGTVVTNIKDLRRPLQKSGLYSAAAYTGPALTNGDILRQIDVPDLGVPYYLQPEAHLQALVSPGSSWNLAISLDTVSASIIPRVGVANSTSYTPVDAGGGVSELLTGPHTVIFYASRISGAASAGFQVNPVPNLQAYSVLAVPQ